MAILRVGVGLTFNGINGDFTTSGIVTAASFSGNLIGNVSGTVTGIASTARSLTDAATGSDLTLTTGLTVGSAFIKPTSIGLGATDTSGRNAGVGTAVGTIIYNSTSNAIEVYDGSSWTQVYNKVLATGGSITQANDKTIHTFTSSGTFTVNAPSTFSIDLLIVAGGGGGTGGSNGGGGAGGMRVISGYPFNQPGKYNIQVGGGGGDDTSGSPSFISAPTIAGFSSITSIGGGAGTSPGGSGGGATWNSPTAFGSSIGITTVFGETRTIQGNPGGNGRQGSGGPGGGNIFGGGGGGGASSVGGDASQPNGGNGGDGLSSTISGASVTYAGGGGAGADNNRRANSQGTGGPGGGGPGGNNGSGTNSSPAVPGTPGTANTGGGGGGGNNTGGGGSGGSGIVIIAYPS